MLFESVLAIGAVLLVGSGGNKIFDTAPTRAALRAAELPATRTAVVTLGMFELVVGLSALAIPGASAPLAVAATYLGFTAFVVYALRRNIPIRSCGCFGKTDTPPSRAHVIVNVAIAVGAVVAAGSPRLLDRVMAEPTSGAVLVLMTGIGAYLLYLILAELPATLAAARPGDGQAGALS
jgi:hypothetical protein